MAPKMMHMVPPKGHGGFSHNGIEVKMDEDGTCMVPPMLYGAALEMGFTDYEAPPAEAPAVKAIGSPDPKSFDLDPIKAKPRELYAFADEHGLTIPEGTQVEDMRLLVANFIAKMKEGASGLNSKPDDRRG